MHEWYALVDSNRYHEEILEIYLAHAIKFDGVLVALSRPVSSSFLATQHLVERGGIRFQVVDGDFEYLRFGLQITSDGTAIAIMGEDIL